MVNEVVLIGNLGKDAEMRNLESGATVVNFSLATNKSWKDKVTGEWQDKTEWHNIVIWRNEHAGELKKGERVRLKGEITYRQYDDKDGNSRWSTDIVCNYFRRLDKREDGASNNSQPAAQPNIPASTNNAGTKAVDDDLPF